MKEHIFLYDAAAAEQLGVTEEALLAALGDPDQDQPDFAAGDQMPELASIATGQCNQLGFVSTVKLALI